MASQYPQYPQLNLLEQEFAAQQLKKTKQNPFAAQKPPRASKSSVAPNSASTKKLSKPSNPIPKPPAPQNPLKSWTAKIGDLIKKKHMEIKEEIHILNQQLNDLNNKINQLKAEVQSLDEEILAIQATPKKSLFHSQEQDRIYEEEDKTEIEKLQTKIVLRQREIKILRKDEKRRVEIKEIQEEILYLENLLQEYRDCFDILKKFYRSDTQLYLKSKDYAYLINFATEQQNEAEQNNADSPLSKELFNFLEAAKPRMDTLQVPKPGKKRKHADIGIKEEPKQAASQGETKKDPRAITKMEVQRERTVVGHETKMDLNQEQGIATSAPVETKMETEKHASTKNNKARQQVPDEPPTKKFKKNPEVVNADNGKPLVHSRAARQVVDTSVVNTSIPGPMRIAPVPQEDLPDADLTPLLMRTRSQTRNAKANGSNSQNSSSTSFRSM